MAGWSEAAQKAGQAYVALVLAVLRDYGATGDQGVHAARFLRASLKGFIDLELGGGFSLPQDVDLSFTKILDLLDAGLRSLSQEYQSDGTTLGVPGELSGGQALQQVGNDRRCILLRPHER